MLSTCRVFNPSPSPVRGTTSIRRSKPHFLRRSTLHLSSSVEPRKRREMTRVRSAQPTPSLEVQKPRHISSVRYAKSAPSSMPSKKPLNPRQNIAQVCTNRECSTRDLWMGSKCGLEGGNMGQEQTPNSDVQDSCDETKLQPTREPESQDMDLSNHCRTPLPLRKLG